MWHASHGLVRLATVNHTWRRSRHLWGNRAAVTSASLLSFAGGIGLFLLGMRLMTDGLKLAAGNALRDILAHWTATPMRGIAAGVLITAAVQSSGAVIFATLGFVNAGLLTLDRKSVV